MSNVTLSIAGREFVVACAAGEEDHISGLGRLIDSKLQEMGGAAGQGEARALLFASLLLADEVHELRLGGSPAPAARGRRPAAGPDISEALEAIAARLESCAATLEG